MLGHTIILVYRALALLFLSAPVVLGFILPLNIVASLLYLPTISVILAATFMFFDSKIKFLASSIHQREMRAKYRMKKLQLKPQQNCQFSFSIFGHQFQFNCPLGL